MAGVLGGFALAMAAGYELFIYEFGGLGGCASDQLHPIRLVMLEYRQQHAGRYPATVEELRQLSVDRWGRNVWLCLAEGKPLEYNPPDDPESDYDVLVRCPHSSHGWLRRFAWAIVEVDDRLLVLRIDSHGRVLDEISTPDR